MTAVRILIFASMTLALAATSIPGHGEEMTGGVYSVEISAITAGGGRAVAAGDITGWGAAAQPLAHGRCSAGTYHLFSGVYTPVIPETTTIAVLALAGAYLNRRHSL